MDFDTLNRKYLKALAQKEVAFDLASACEKKIEELTVNYNECCRAREIIREVAKDTQEHLKISIEQNVQAALDTVFGEGEYQFEIEFVENRNQVECNFILKTPTMITKDIEFADGGGIVNAIALGLQMSVLSVMRDRSRPLFIADEPMTALKGDDYPEMGMLAIKTLADALGITVIMVSHDPDQISQADAIFNVEKIDGKSQVERIL